MGTNDQQDYHLFEISESVALLEQATEANQRQIQQVAENTSRQISELATNTAAQLREIAIAGEKRGVEFQNEMKGLASEFSHSRQTNWPLVIAFISLVLMFIGGAYKIVDLTTQVTMAPVVAMANVSDKDRLALHQGQEANARTIASQQTNQKIIETKLAEIETQFKASDQARNVQFSEQQRMNNLIMQISQGAGRDAEHTIKYPDAPYYHPMISSDGQSPSLENQQ